MNRAPRIDCASLSTVDVGGLRRVAAMVIQAAVDVSAPRHAHQALAFVRSDAFTEVVGLLCCNAGMIRRAILAKSCVPVEVRA